MNFRLIMISAMYENGGNTVHRFLDGHEQIYVYPFESQLGTILVRDHLTSLFPVKYRWPVFDLSASPEQDYSSIIDEECKIRAITPTVSKFRHIPINLDDKERKAIFCNHIKIEGRERSKIISAFFRSTFEAWRDHKSSGRETFYMGYSPIVVVDTEKILSDFPEAHIMHVIRNPWSAYADTKKRPVPMILDKYASVWIIVQQQALFYSRLFPKNVHIVRYEDVIVSPEEVLGAVCSKIGLVLSPALRFPSWNGDLLEEVYPWGTIRKALPQVNIDTAKELSNREIERIRLITQDILKIFDYSDFI